MIKSAVKQYLSRLGILEKIQYSNWYRNTRFPDVKKFQQENYRFYKTHLAPNDLVFDIGANVGDHTYNLSRIAGKVITVEPDKQNLRVLKSRFGSYSNVTIVPKAISDKQGVATFFSEGAGSPFNSLSTKWVDTLGNESESRFEKKVFKETYEVETITIEDLIREFGVPGFVKVDVEGFERQVFEPLEHVIRLITFESNLPEFREETIWIINKLSSLSPAYRYNFFRNYSGFELQQNVTAEEAILFLQHTEHRFLEVICKIESR